MLNLDTHILLYALMDDLNRREASVLSNDAWSISAIVLWEIGKLSELGRIPQCHLLLPAQSLILVNLQRKGVNLHEGNHDRHSRAFPAGESRHGQPVPDAYQAAKRGSLKDEGQSES